MKRLRNGPKPRGSVKMLLSYCRDWSVRTEENTGTHKPLQIQYPQLEVVHSRDVSSGTVWLRMDNEITLHVYDSNQLA